MKKFDNKDKKREYANPVIKVNPQKIMGRRHQHGAMKAHVPNSLFGGGGHYRRFSTSEPTQKEADSESNVSSTRLAEMQAAEGVRAMIKKITDPDIRKLVEACNQHGYGSKGASSASEQAYAKVQRKVKGGNAPSLEDLKALVNALLRNEHKDLAKALRKRLAKNGAEDKAEALDAIIPADPKDEGNGRMRDLHDDISPNDLARFESTKNRRQSTFEAENPVRPSRSSYGYGYGRRDIRW